MPVLAQTTILDQIELKANRDTGNIAYVFKQELTTVTSDGQVIAEQFNRSAMLASDPQATALLGQALSGALAELQAAKAALEAAQAQAEQLAKELADLRAQVQAAP